jgi:hypothetical protein
MHANRSRKSERFGAFMQDCGYGLPRTPLLGNSSSVTEGRSGAKITVPKGIVFGTMHARKLGAPIAEADIAPPMGTVGCF